MATNTTPRRYTVNVEGDATDYASKAKALAAFHAAAVAGRTVHVFTPAGNLAHGYLAEQGPVEVVDGELRAIVTAPAPTAEQAATPARFVPVRTRSGGTVHLAVSATSSVTACGSKTAGALPAGTAVTCGRCTRTAEKIAAREQAATPAVEAPAPIAEQAAELADARRTSTEQAASYAAHVAEVTAAGGPIADAQLADLADALRGTPAPTERVEVPATCTPAYYTTPRRAPLVDDPAELELEAAARRRQLDAAIVEDMLTGDVEPYLAEPRPARSAAGGRGRQLALIPLTPDEDGAQLDLLELAAEAGAIR